MSRNRWVATLGAAAVLGSVAAGPALAQPTPTPGIPFTTPNTDGCPDRLAPPPPVDESEAPAPGQTVPPPLPVPAAAVGGPNLGQCGVITPAGAPPVPSGLSASAWVISDLDTGKVLAAKDPHGRYRPASTIKVLLSIVALRNLNLSTVVTGTGDDMNADGTRVGIGPGGRYSNLQLMQALLMCSGNDAAHAIATQLGGMDATVAKMNAEARSLSALDTRTATPSGLDGPGMQTSAYDMSLFFREAGTIPQFVNLIHTEQATFPGYPANPETPGDTPHVGFAIANDNPLLYDYDGAIGFKNGFTDDARQTLVGAALRNGHRIAVVLMHADIQPERPVLQEARLLDYGFGLEAAGLAPVGDLIAPDAAASAAATTTNAPLAAPPADASGGGQARTGIVVGGTALALLLVWTAARLSRRRRRRH